MRTVKMPPKLSCSRCGHSWRPRGDIVTICPKCKSPYWDKPRKDLSKGVTVGDNKP